MTLMARAHLLGMADAFTKFAFGVDTPHDLVTALGAVHPGAAALGAGFTAPDNYGVGQAVRTGLGAAGGSYIGADSGAAAGTLLAKILHTHPALFQEVGRVLGKAVGGATGAHAGHVWADNVTADHMRKKRLLGGV